MREVVGSVRVRGGERIEVGQVLAFDLELWRVVGKQEDVLRVVEINKREYEGEVIKVKRHVRLIGNGGGVAGWKLEED